MKNLHWKRTQKKITLLWCQYGWQIRNTNSELHAPATIHTIHFPISSVRLHVISVIERLTGRVYWAIRSNLCWNICGITADESRFQTEAVIQLQLPFVALEFAQPIIHILLCIELSSDAGFCINLRASQVHLFWNFFWWLCNQANRMMLLRQIKSAFGIDVASLCMRCVHTIFPKKWENIRNALNMQTDTRQPNMWLDAAIEWTFVAIQSSSSRCEKNFPSNSIKMAVLSAAHCEQDLKKKSCFICDYFNARARVVGRTCIARWRFYRLCMRALQTNADAFTRRMSSAIEQQLQATRDQFAE